MPHVVQANTPDQSKISRFCKDGLKQAWYGNVPSTNLGRDPRGTE